MSCGNPLLRAAGIPLALQKEGEARSLSQLPQMLPMVGIRVEELFLCSDAMHFCISLSSPERKPTVVSITTVVQV